MSHDQKKARVPWGLIIGGIIVLLLIWWFFLRGDTATSADLAPVAEAVPITAPAA